MYMEWGFTSCPFEPEALKPDEIGNQLLVGREVEIRSVVTRLTASKKLITFDGSNGVGKTSLVNIALYRSYSNYLKEPTKHPLLIPCRTVFQLDDIENLENFRTTVMLEVAQTLIEKKRELSSLEVVEPGGQKLLGLLTEDLLAEWESSVQGVVASNAGGNSTLESAAGPASSMNNFDRRIKDWLSKSLGGDSAGAVVCVLDNLELLQTSKKARQCLESLRDTLFAVKGIRWVLCGANNIILSVASSPRLVGHLEHPIEVAPLKKNCTHLIFSSRQEAYRNAVEGTYLPLTSSEFDLLYTILNHNLRTTLSKCHDYCIYMYENNLKPVPDLEKKIHFEKWLTRESNDNEKACSALVKAKAFEVFDKAAMNDELKNSFSLSQFELFGFESVNALRPLIKELEDAGVLISQIDEDDNRRKTISVTPKGWLVNYSRLLSGKATVKSK